ncbi:MAG TPA: isoleucine--tRNA ligase [Symbiobacteriaceae bacterium]|nr:isoleucine--tRNA ligase [Symbiobacteriaceae bacterium]
MLFQHVPSRTSPVRREQQVLEYWRQSGAFAQTQQANAGADFVFYEGPPTANGKPHAGHMIPRALKDLFARYQSMSGRRVLRKAGWDTHGLPVELEVEKELGLSGKPQVEAYGVARFTQKCRESVWRYKADWETNATERLGYWLDMEEPYVTYADNYVESVWWALRRFWDMGLLYQGHKVVPYCPRCGTALSSHEVAQGYHEVEDPAVTVRFPVTTPGPLQHVRLLAWTTTPWTLPMNMALAVRSDAVYAVADVEGERVLMLKDRLPEDALVLQELEGSELEGLTYAPPFPFAPAGGHRVLTADWVATTEGTGVVHVSPAFGEDDFRLGAEHGLPLFCPVDDEGRYTEAVPPWQGWKVRDANADVIEALRACNWVYEESTVSHAYPFCWRCDTPLLYVARKSWFLKTTALKDQLLAANADVLWQPEHYREGRFGNFLGNVVDWCLSRERYWGTPLPLWECGCGHRHLVGSFAELEAMAGRKVTDVHRPGVDELELTCPQCGGKMRRVSEVIDCWFDSGCMPFAQHHYPFENGETYLQQFPADFICEAVDQTRGWFYSLLVVGVGLFGRAPYRRVLVTEFGLDERGKKMSKSRRNVVDLGDVLDQFGADALRFYVYSSGQPWLPKKISKAAVGEAAKVLETLRNVYSFFVLYANLENWAPEAPVADRLTPLDRWLLARLQAVTAEVHESLSAYDVVTASRTLTAWVDDLSNWYVRLSRRRFWNGGPEGRPAFATLHHALKQTALLMAPMTPFLAESIWQNLTLGVAGSVHLQPFPNRDEALANPQVEEQMLLLRRYATAGRSAREKAGRKVRQPLSAMLLLGAPAELGGMTDLLQTELNVRTAVLADDAPEGFVTGEEAGCVVAVDPALTPELLREGLAREVVNRLQRHRKELGLAVEDRVELLVNGTPQLLAALEEYKDYVAREVQAVTFKVGPVPEDVPCLEATFDGQQLLAVVTPAVTSAA